MSYKLKPLIKPFNIEKKELRERAKLTPADIRYIEQQPTPKRMKIGLLEISRLIESGLVCKSFIEHKRKEALSMNIMSSIYGDRNG